MLDPKIKYVVDHYTASKSYYTNLRLKFRDWDWLFFGIRNTPKYNWMSNVSDPSTYRAIMVILAKIMNVTFAKDPPFDVFGREESDEQFAPLIKDLIKFQFENCGLYHKYMQFVLQALIRGTSVGKVYWKKETKIRTFREPIKMPIQEMIPDPMTGMMTPQTVGEEIVGYEKIKRSVTTYDDPWFEVVDIRDFFPEPGASETKDGTMIHRTFKTIDDLKKQRKQVLPNGEEIGIYENISDIKPDETRDDTEWQDAHSRLDNMGLSSPMQHRTYPTSEKKAKLSKLVEILETHCKYDINSDGKLEDCIITVANSNTLLRAIENPFYHGESSFIKVVYEPVLYEFHGRGVGEIAEGSQNELNDKRNQRLDNINQILQPVMQYVEGLVHPAVIKNFRHAPGAKMPVRHINATKWDRPPDVTMGVHIEIQDLKKDIQDATGATAHTAPTADIKQTHRTASGVMMLQGMASERLKPVIQLMEEQGLKKIVEKFHQLNQQFITEERAVRILGDKGAAYKQIPAEAHQSIVDFIPAGSKEMANREMSIMQVLRFLEVASKIPDFNIALNYAEIGDEITTLFGFKNRGFIKSEQEIKQARQQQLVQQLLMGGMGQKGAESATKERQPIQEMSGQGGGADNLRQMFGLQRG